MDDLISKEQAIDKIKKRLFETALNNAGIKQDIDETLVDVAENRLGNWLDELPSVQPERKTGRWIESNPQDSKLCRLMTCSECGKAYIVNIDVPYEDWAEAHKFCVECGADMKGDKYETD